MLYESKTYVNQAGETSHVCECSSKVLARINVLFLLIFALSNVASSFHSLANFAGLSK
jgi:hypothetical protein